MKSWTDRPLRNALRISLAAVVTCLLVLLGSLPRHGGESHSQAAALVVAPDCQAPDRQVPDRQVPEQQGASGQRVEPEQQSARGKQDAPEFLGARNLLQAFARLERGELEGPIVDRKGADCLFGPLGYQRASSFVLSAEAAASAHVVSRQRAGCPLLEQVQSSQLPRGPPARAS